uniref:cellulose 1,4-beta-cellobiosidase (non-reducing end) n=1 Tax=Daphnia galeata TaxID=27404 RepID=A0A8J2RQ39_9CRUS|nr:unnamed protein product [Daphnia galeata]
MLKIGPLELLILHFSYINGCAYLPYALGKKIFYGCGPSYCVDTIKPFTIVTRFVSDDGTDTGNLKEIQRFYKQNGRTIPNPTVSDFNSISDACCAHYNFNNLGGISAMNYGLKKGMVLTMGMAGYPDNPDVWGWLDKNPMVLVPSIVTQIPVSHMAISNMGLSDQLPI